MQQQLPQVCRPALRYGSPNAQPHQATVTKDVVKIMCNVDPNAAVENLAWLSESIAPSQQALLHFMFILDETLEHEHPELGLKVRFLMIQLFKLIGGLVYLLRAGVQADQRS